MRSLLQGLLTVASIALATHAAGAERAGDAGQGAPPHSITARDLISLDQLGGDFGLISVSPDQRSLAFQVKHVDLSAHTFRSAWYVLSVHGGAPVRIGDFGDVQFNPVPGGRLNGVQAPTKPQWSPDSRWVAYLRKNAGQVQVWRAHADGSGEEQITHNVADVMSFQWHTDSAGLFFTVGRDRSEMARADQEEGDRGYLLDDRFMPEYSTKVLWLSCGEDGWGLPTPASEACTPRTWSVTFGQHERQITSEEHTALLASMQEDRPRGIAASRAIQSTIWDFSKKRVAWLENEDPGAMRGYAASLTLFADGRRCGAAECHGQLTQSWWLNGRLIFQRMEGSAYSLPALYEWRPGSSAVRLIYRLDGKLESCALAQAALICLQESPTAPRKLVSIALDKGKVSTLYDPNPQFVQFTLGRVERIEWQDGYGNDAFGHLVYPAGYVAGRPYPLVIVQYRSRGFLNGGVGDEYPIFPLAAAGFLVLSFDSPDDLRLAARYPLDNLQDLAALEAKEWQDGYQFRRKLNALNLILDRLAQRGLVDPKRVGITGLSDGASTTDYALFNSTRFAAAAISGDWTPESYLLQASEPLRAFTRSYLAADSGRQAMERWAGYALSDHAQQVQTPLLIQVSDTELVQTTPLFVSLKDAQKPVEAYVFPDEYHIKWQPQHKLAVAERAIDWFRFWLLGEEDRAPGKADQYARWHRLRARPER